MLTIKVEKNRDPEIVLLENADEIRFHTINAIEESMEVGIDFAHSVELDVEGEIIDFVIKKENWESFLNDSIKPLQQTEDISLLIKVQKLLKQIQNHES